MKKLAILTIALFSLGLNAQELDGGLKAGVNFIDVNVDDFDPGQAYETLESDNRGVGYHAGVYFRFRLAGLFIQPEFVYTQMHQTLTAHSSGPETRDVKINFNRFDIPMLVGLNAGPLRLGAGPVASFNLNARTDLFNENLRNATWGYQVGVGFDISPISIDARYEGPFSNTADRVVIDGETFVTDARANQIILSLGLQLF